MLIPWKLFLHHCWLINGQRENVGYLMESLLGRTLKLWRGYALTLAPCDACPLRVHLSDDEPRWASLPPLCSQTPR